MQKLAAAMLLILAGQAQAEWYETTGQAAIRNGDQAAARAQATEDAVKRALLFAGVSVRSVQQVTDGLLTQDSMQLKSHGEVQQVHLVSERATNGTFEVTIRADIVPGEAACPNVAYKKKLLIAPFKLKVPEQAVIGDLFELGKVSSELFNDKLTELSQSSWTQTLPAPLDVGRLSYNERKAIARQYGARYVLSATLNDVSLGESSGTNWQFWTDKDRERFYHLQLSVFDLAEARLVLQQKYQTSAIWRVRKTTALDPQYHRFWQSSYGQAAERVLDAAVLDVEEAIRCEPVVAELLQVRDNQVLLNLGSAHGVQIGDTFTLVHRRELNDNFGQTQPLLAVTNMTVKITQLSHEAAWAQSVDGQLLANVQVGDLAQAAKTVVKDEWVEQE
ncbi:flagellar assembly protein T N-terminal domain-containing protein [Rheinheimera sp.]|uniref:flagellar assembly protein T N-terminal domain-containing protein n=1 Tax=Rheinheimera sp. TaxID=1869214 RepID=UPI0027BA98BB|nr:flagellar assembly protein T N-terminal domain-containing protein [Rheinheimera sp.]